MIQVEQHYDLCINTQHWNKQTRASATWLKRAATAYKREAAWANRQAYRTIEPGLDEGKFGDWLATNGAVQALLVLLLGSSLLPLLGYVHLVGYGVPAGLGRYLTPSDLATAGLTGLLAGIAPVVFYSFIRTRRHFDYYSTRPRVDQYVRERIPQMDEALTVTSSYGSLVLFWILDDNSSWSIVFPLIIVGGLAASVSYSGRILASYYFRNDHIVGLVASLAIVLVASSAGSGILRRDRHERTEYSYSFTTTTAIYESCVYVVLRPVPRLLILESRRGDHSIILQASDVKEIIRMEPNTVSCAPL